MRITLTGLGCRRRTRSTRRVTPIVWHTNLDAQCIIKLPRSSVDCWLLALATINTSGHFEGNTWERCFHCWKHRRGNGERGASAPPTKLLGEQVIHPASPIFLYFLKYFGRHHIHTLVSQVCYHSATQSRQFDVSFSEKLLKIVATRGEIFSLKFTKYRDPITSKMRCYITLWNTNVRKMKRYSEVCTVIVINGNCHSVMTMLKCGGKFLTVK